MGGVATFDKKGSHFQFCSVCLTDFEKERPEN